VSQTTDLLRAYLRQRRDLGETELVLGRSSAVDLLGLIEGGMRQRLPDPGDAIAAHRNNAATVAPPAPGESGGAARGSAKAPPRPGEHATGTTALDLTDQQIVQLGTLAELRTTALGCPRCRLSETRKQVVFGEGSERADLMVVGEAPGAEEDRTGRPFVGRAGKLLDLLLASIGFPRESVYICNVLKCRPPGNRDPMRDEIEACSPYLLRQIELVAPRVILAVGGFPSQTLLASQEPIGRLRGRVHEYQGVPLVPTYHPAALLRNPGWIRPVWDDLQRLRTLLDDSPARA
jgi:uracil-DNA glycosylase family 4